MFDPFVNPAGDHARALIIRRLCRQAPGDAGPTDHAAMEHTDLNSFTGSPHEQGAPAVSRAPGRIVARCVHRAQLASRVELAQMDSTPFGALNERARP